MKTKNQGNLSAEVFEVEHLFFANVNGREILFLKPRNEKAVAYKLPNDFIQKVIQSQKSNPKQ